MKTVKLTLPRMDLMKRSILLSFLLHLILILIIQLFFPFNFPKEEMRTYEVELMRAPVLDINTDLIPDEIITRLIEEKQLSANNPEEETISLDTKDTRYLNYAQLLRQKIGTQWRYPVQAMEALIEGKLSLLFTLNRNGGLMSVSVVHSSGYDLLDREASRAVQTASPYPPFPDRISAKRLNIFASFDYRLTSRKTMHH